MKIHWLIQKLKDKCFASATGNLKDEELKANIDAHYALTELNRRKYPEWERLKSKMQDEIATCLMMAMNDVQTSDYKNCIENIRRANYRYRAFIGFEYPEFELNKLENKNLKPKRDEKTVNSEPTSVANAIGH